MPRRRGVDASLLIMNTFVENIHTQKLLITADFTEIMVFVGIVYIAYFSIYLGTDRQKIYMLKNANGKPKYFKVCRLSITRYRKLEKNSFESVQTS